VTPRRGGGVLDHVLGVVALAVLAGLALCGGCVDTSGEPDGHLTWVYCERAFACGADPELCYSGALAPDDPEACEKAIAEATCAELEAPPCEVR
jgi:hypothetical protein